MLISHKKKFIFIHIPKNAGTSVRKVFIPECRIVDRIAYQYAPVRTLLAQIHRLSGWDRKQLTGFDQHAHACEISDQLGADVYAQYYSFAFVRNPYDWLVSLYFYVRQHKPHPGHAIANTMDFNDYIAYYINRKPWHQVDYLTDSSGEIIVKHVGRYEQLGEEIRQICEHLGLSTRILPQSNISKIRSKIDYRTFYDDATIQLVTDYFKRDLSLLDYQFDQV